MMFNHYRNEVKGMKAFFENNNINVSFSETYEGTEMKCYDRNILPDVDVYYNFDTSYIETLSRTTNCLMNIEEKENKPQMLNDIAEELMSYNDYGEGVVEVSYVSDGYKKINADTYLEMAEKEIAHRENRIEAGEHELNI